MKNRLTTAVAALLAALALGGCAATVQRSAPAQATAQALSIPAEAGKKVVLNLQLDPQHPRDDGWEAFRQEWVAITQEQAQAQGFEFSVQDGEPKPVGQDGTLLAVLVRDYRHVTIGKRMMLGIMSGNAYVDATIQFRSLKTGEVYGERTYNTSSSAWQGVFSAMTPKQLYAIADEALGEIKRR